MNTKASSFIPNRIVRPVNGLLLTLGLLEKRSLSSTSESLSSIDPKPGDMSLAAG